MRQIFSIVATVIVAASLVCSDESVKNSGTATSAAAITADDKSTMKVDENAENTVKTKRGIHIASGITYTVPSSSYSRYNPYARFPGIYKASFNPIASFNPHYVLTPGNAVVHSFSATYPRLYLPPKPVLRPAIPSPVLVPKPIVVPSIYANRYPVFVPKPSVIPRPIVPVSNVPQFSVQSTPHIHTASGPFAFPSNAQQPTFIGQNAWRPSLSSAPSAQPSPANTPSLTVLPPFNSVNGQLASSNLIQRPNNYYLPVEQLQQDVATRSAQIAQVGLTHANISKFFLWIMNRNHFIGLLNV